MQTLDGIFAKSGSKVGLSSDQKLIWSCVNDLVQSSAEFKLSACSVLEALVARNQYEAAMLVL